MPLPRQRLPFVCVRNMFFLPMLRINARECSMPSTEVEIHFHPRIHLNPMEEVYACQVPKGAWHKVEVYEPSVIFDAKDGAYGSDGSEILRTT